MRKIIHLDMDCFYAAVEMRDDPTLKGKPVAVGGGHRGVVATCNYEARKFGVHSAMSSAYAREICPGLIFLPVNMAKYKHESEVIRGIMSDYTSLIEPLSLDEAYLDVTDCPLHKNSATLIARQLRADIFKTTGLTASAGVAPNKFLAKVGSDWNKPNGMKVVTPDEIADFVVQLPVGKIPGVGKVSVAKLAKLGIKTCRDLQKYKREELQERFGKFGELLYQRSHGIDNRAVSTSRVRKSLSVEDTFPRDLVTPEECQAALGKILTELERRLARHIGTYQVAGVFVKVKFSDFVITTKQLAGGKLDLPTLMELFLEARQRSPKAIRLLGAGVNFADPDAKPKDKEDSASADSADSAKSTRKKSSQPRKSVQEEPTAPLFPLP